MGIKVYKPTTSGRRKSTVDDFSDITAKGGEKSLKIINKRKGGRNYSGRITVRHRGGGAKRYYRIIDFKRNKYDIPAKVISIEYDPNRNARIALLCYADGEKNYIIAPAGLKTGDKIISSRKDEIEIKPGNASTLEKIPVGTFIYNIELTPERGGELVRAAGLGALLMGLEGKYAQIKLPSGEIRLVRKDCIAVIGQVSNPDYRLIRWGKAGRIRHLGVRPTVRGKVMNPCDHPHGGGEGRNPIGLKYPKTPWGKHALGVKTRNTKKSSSRLIIHRRKRR